MKIWELDKNNHTLYCSEDGRRFYGVTLEHCNSGAAIADWIFQVSKKSWCANELLGELVRELNRILDPQKNFCSWGENKTIGYGQMHDFLNARYKEVLKNV